MTEDNFTNKIRLPHEIFDQFLQDVRDRKDFPEYPTYLETLDEYIWGIHKKELLIIAARPSHGKTSLALQIAWNLAKNQKSSIFLSLEMSQESIMERIVCNELGINQWRLRKGNEDVKLFLYANEKSFKNILDVANLMVIDSIGKTIPEIEKILNEYKPDCLFIDHAQMISPRGFASKQDALSFYVQNLKTLAIKNNCAVVLTSQINRGGANVENAVNFLKGSGELEEGADTILQCRWPIKDNSKEDINRYIVSIIKQRHGPCVTKEFYFNPSCFKFSIK